MLQSLGKYGDDFVAAVAADFHTLGQNPLRNRRALAIGAATALAVWGALLLNLDYPMWSGMSALTVTSATVQATLLKGILRIVGTIAGALLAAFLVGFVAGNNLLSMIALFTTVYFALYREYTSPYPYAWILFGVTCGLILMESMAVPASGLHVAAYRAAEILVGVISTFIVSAFLLPPESDPAHDRALAAAKLDNPALARRVALEAAVGLCIVVGLYAFLGLPGFTSAAVSLTRVVDPQPELGRQRALLRLLGCFIGGGTGLALVAASIQLLPAFLFVIFVFATIFGYMLSGSAAISYAGLQAGFAFVIAYAPSITPTTTLDPAIDRFAGILLAFVVFWVIDMVFATDPPAPPQASKERAAKEGAAKEGAAQKGAEK